MDKQNLCYINKQIRTEVLVNYRIIIHERSVCCKRHIKDGNIDSATILKFENDTLNEETALSVTEIVTLIDRLRNYSIAEKKVKTSQHSFFDNMNDEETQTWTGLDKTQLSNMTQHCFTKSRNMPRRNINMEYT